jgi:hypothetical protein
MKKTISIIALCVILFSCSKQRPTTNIDVEPSYLGTYDSRNGDTSYVTKNNQYISIGWANMNGNRRIYFDSTRINPDSTFTVNQIVNEYLWVYSKAVGTGRFYNNTLTFEIFIGTNGRITFSGVKRN